MHHARLRRWIAQVQAGRLPRRDFLLRLAQLGLLSSTAARHLMFRLNVSALSNRLAAPLTGWGLDMSTLTDWYRPT